MYTTKRLRTDSYEEFFSACESAGLVFDGEIITASHNHAMDLIGDLYRPTGEVEIDEEGNEIPVMGKLDGYHVNIKEIDNIGLDDLIVVPNVPMRKFAGDNE